MLRPAILALALASPAAAVANVTLTFDEGAPKDRFILTSDTGLCADGPVRVTVDLTGSAGALIFDVTAEGAGVEVFQPFELVSGGELVLSAPEVLDGDKVVSLDLSGLSAGAEVAFTIDVDDTINAREITVNNAEIEGAVLVVESGGTSVSAPFGGNAVAQINGIGCQS